MKTPTFIVLATYNGIKYVAKQLDSLLAQSWPCYIYVFDDGSTDGTIELIQTKYLRHENIFLSINKERLGFVRNFEQGIKQVYGLGAKSIALSDQDDIWHVNRLEQMNEKLLHAKQEQPILVYSDLEMIDSNGKILHPSYMRFRNYNARAPGSLATALGQNGVMGNTILMNRCLIKRILPFPDELHAHDYWISLVAHLIGKRIFIPRALVKYRIHDNNASNSIDALSSSQAPKDIPLWRLFSNRDYRLPFMEDSRNQTIKFLLDHNQDEITKDDASLIEGFINYLNLGSSRWYLAYWMLKNKFVRKNLRYKARFIYRLLVTTRYNDRRGAR